MRKLLVLICITCLFKVSVSCNVEPGQAVDDEVATQNEPRNPLDPIESIQIVYIGASSCPYCTAEEGLKNLNNIFYKVDELANELSINAWYTGVAADEDPKTGFDHLMEVGTFNEINTGAYYFNLGHLKYVWGEGDFAGPAIVPQILINRSTYQIEPAGMSIGDVERDERILRRYSGTSEIAALADRINEMSLLELKEYLGLE